MLELERGLWRSCWWTHKASLFKCNALPLFSITGAGTCQLHVESDLLQQERLIEELLCLFFRRTAGTLPLPPPKSASNPRPRIDFVVFMVDMTNRQSFHTVREAATQVDVEFFFGRSCLLATRGKHFPSLLFPLPPLLFPYLQLYLSSPLPLNIS